MISNDTEFVHGGRDGLRSLGVHAAPIDLSTTYPITDLTRAGQSLDVLAHGESDAPDHVYMRLFNPTVARFEHAIAALERLPQAVAFASGMATITACLLAAKALGDHVIAVRPLYGGTDHLLASGLLGIEATFATAEDFHEHIRPETSLILLETPANPTLDLVNIADVVSRSKGIAVLVDSTFATPVLQQPAHLGATLVLHSATKYIGGHGDAMGGVVATDAEWAARIRGVRVATGAVLHPEAAYALHRGLQTLAVRMHAAQANAIRVARWLQTHPRVERVHFPGLSEQSGLVGTQMRGPGAMVSFEVEGGFFAARRLVESVKLITPAVSLGSTDSLIQHPASLTHRVVDEDARHACGIVPALVRLSVGLERAEDLIEDLEQALAPARQGQLTARLARC